MRDDNHPTSAWSFGEGCGWAIAWVLGGAVQVTSEACPLRSPQCGGPIRESHIIPEYFYKYMYDHEDHSFVLIDADHPNVGVRRKGAREPLLCDGCERFLNQRYETPVTRIWDRLIPDVASSRETRIQVDDPATMKLLHLSIFWRASRSEQKWFRKCRLHPRNEERLRQMIVAGDPGRPVDFPVLGYLVTHLGSTRTAKEFLVTPLSSIVPDFQLQQVTMFYGGCRWTMVSGMNAFRSAGPEFLGASRQLTVHTLRIEDQQNLTTMLFDKVRSDRAHREQANRKRERKPD